MYQLPWSNVRLIGHLRVWRSVLLRARSFDQNLLVPGLPVQRFKVARPSGLSRSIAISTRNCPKKIMQPQFLLREASRKMLKTTCPIRSVTQPKNQFQLKDRPHPQNQPGQINGPRSRAANSVVHAPSIYLESRGKSQKGCRRRGKKHGAATNRFWMTQTAQTLRPLSGLALFSRHGVCPEKHSLLLGRRGSALSEKPGNGK